MTVTASYMSDDSDATHVIEGHDASSQVSYRIQLTVMEVNPDTLAMDELKLEDIKLSCLPHEDMFSHYEFVLYGGLTPNQRVNIGRALNSEGVPLAICDAIVYHIFNVYRFAEVAGVDREQVQAHVRIESNSLHEFAQMDEGDDDYVRPTPASRDSVEALEKVVIAENQDTRCTICMEDFCFGLEVTKMPCSHLFHGDCIARWLDSQVVCPLCRFELPAATDVAYTIDIGTLIFDADYMWVLC